MKEVPLPPRLSPEEYNRLSKKEMGYLAIAFAIVFFICVLSVLFGYGAHALSNII